MTHLQTRTEQVWTHNKTISSPSKQMDMVRFTHTGGVEVSSYSKAQVQDKWGNIGTLAELNTELDRVCQAVE